MADPIKLGCAVRKIDDGLDGVTVGYTEDAIKLGCSVSKIDDRVDGVTVGDTEDAMKLGCSVSKIDDRLDGVTVGETVGAVDTKAGIGIDVGFNEGSLEIVLVLGGFVGLKALEE